MVSKPTAGGEWPRLRKQKKRGGVERIYYADTRLGQKLGVETAHRNEDSTNNNPDLTG